MGDVVRVMWAALAEGEEPRPVEVLRVGAFVDRNGKDVEIGETDLDAFAANFEAGTAGQDVPVDLEHAYGEAAGWVRRLWRDGEKLLAEIEWNSLGRQLVGDQVYRYVSASLDLAGKVLRSVSLVNFPAVKGLAPVELSEGVYGLESLPPSSVGLVERVVEAVRGLLEGRTTDLEMITTDSEMDDETGGGEMGMTDEERAALREELRGELVAEMEARRQSEAELREQLRGELQAELTARFERRQGFAEFAERVCGGDAGLSAKPEDVVEFLAGLPEDAVEQAQALLESKVVDFSERGSGRDGNAGKAEVPRELRAALTMWLESGGELAEWFAINEDVVGPMAGYDLSAWEKDV